MALRYACLGKLLQTPLPQKNNVKKEQLPDTVVADILPEGVMRYKQIVA